MDRQGRSRTLRVFAVLWVFLPLLLVMLGFFVAGALAFERLLTDLLVDRHLLEYRGTVELFCNHNQFDL